MNKLPEVDQLDLLLYASIAQAKDKDIEAHAAVVPTVVMSERKKTQMKKRVLQEWNEIRKWWREGYRIRISTAKRLAVAVLIFIAMCFGCVLSIEGVRTSIRDAFVEWYETYIAVAFVQDETVEELMEIEEYKEPVVGEGFVRTEVYRDDTKLIIEYTKGDDWISYNQRIFEENNIYLSNNDSKLKDISINGNQGVCGEITYKSGVYTEIMWYDSAYVYWITSNISEFDLFSIAESVK